MTVFFPTTPPIDFKASLFGRRTSSVHLPFIEKECSGRALAAIIQSDIRFVVMWAGLGREILTDSGWWQAVGAGLVDGSVSRLAQLSSRREREETIYTGYLGNAEEKNAKIWQLLSDKVMTLN